MFQPLTLTHPLQLPLPPAVLRRPSKAAPTPAMSLPSTPGRTAAVLYSFHGPPTVPTTPVAPGEEPLVLFGCVMGGGDSRVDRSRPAGVLSASLGRSPSLSSPLRASSRRMITDARRNATGLGSPIRLQQQRNVEGSGSRRALVRAAPAPMPLCQYPTPPRNNGTTSQQESTIVHGAVGTSDLGTPSDSLRALEGSSSDSSPSTTTSHTFPSSRAPNQDDPAENNIHTTVALAVLAAIEDAVKGKCSLLFPSVSVAHNFNIPQKSWGVRPPNLNHSTEQVRDSLVSRFMPQRSTRCSHAEASTIS